MAAVYYIITSDGRKFYYRDSVRISDAEGIRLGARSGSPSRTNSPLRLSTNGCDPGQVRNTESGKCIKIGGRKYKELMKGKSRKPPRTPSRRSSQCPPCPQLSTDGCLKGQVRNTETGKCIKIGGRVYKQLMKGGSPRPQRRSSQLSHSPRPQLSRSPCSQLSTGGCKAGYIRNTKTGKCIKIGGRVHKQLMKERSGPLPSSGIPSADKCEGVVCAADKICNPTSGKCIGKGKRAYNQLVKCGIIQGEVIKPKAGVARQPMVRRAGIARQPVERIEWERVRRVAQDCVRRSGLELRDLQMKVVEYMEDHDALLVVHGTGCGKTLTAVACSQCYLDKNPSHSVVFVGPASLTENFKKEMVSYGVRNPDKYEFYSFAKFLQIHKTGMPVSIIDKFLIIDEAHNLRNPLSQTSQAIVEASFNAPKKLLLTATPFVNGLLDFIPLINMLYGRFVVGNRVAFNNNEVDEWIGKKPDDHNLTVLRYLLRNRIDMVDCKNTEFFAKRYDHMVDVPMSKEYYKRYVQLVAGEDIFGDIFAHPQAFYNGYRQATQRAGPGYFSAKVEAAVPILAKGKSIIYSNWLEYGVEPIAEVLKAHGITFRSFYGAVTMKDRAEMVKSFNEGKFNVLILTKAGGEGIDLKGVRTVVVLDPPWNEAGVEQIVGRAIRYKSHEHLPEEERNVNVYNMVLTKPLSVATLDAAASGDKLLYGIIEQKSAISTIVMNLLEAISI